MIETTIQMRFADIDRLGHVNNVVLQHYFDLGKTDYYDTVLRDRIDWEGEALIQRATHTTYEAQTLPDEPIVVRTRMERVGTTSFTLYQEIVNRENGEVKAISRSTLVMYDFGTQRKIAIPEEWRQAISNFENETF